MLKFREKMGSIFLIDEQTEVIQYEVTEPAVLFDKDEVGVLTLLKIGNRDMVMEYYEKSIEKVKNSHSDMFESWIVMDLPKDAEILDKILNNTGYLETFYQKTMSSLQKGE